MMDQLSSHSFDKIIGEVASEDRLLTAIFAILLAACVGLITGPVGGNANPALWNFVDRIFGGLARKTYNTDRSPSSLAFRGGFFTILYIVLAFAIGAGFHLLNRNFPLAGFTEPILLSLVMGGGAVWYSLNKLFHALAEGKKLTKGSYLPIAVSTRSNLNTTDDFGITRVGVGYMAQIFDKGLVAPLFWFLIGGVPLAYLYAGIMAARWGLAKDGFAKGLGDAAMWLERLFGFFPYLISSLFMAVAALFTPGAQLSRAVPGFFGSAGRAPYAEGGLPVTAVAWALKISLGGPVEDLDGSVVKRSWVGPKNASAKVDKGQLRRALYMSVMAYVLVVSALIAGIVLHRLA
jgi:adenosylcobinamide-phosphate synthase